MKTKTFLLLALFVCVFAFSEELYDRNDPDDFFDNVGATPDLPSYAGDRDGDVREAGNTDHFATGIIIGTISNSHDAGRASVVRPNNGKIIVVGRTQSGADNNFMIISYNPDGSLDSSFNTTGKHVASFRSASGDDTAHAVALQTNGALLVAGRTSPGVYSFAILRLTTGGALDTTFNTDGKQTTTFTASGNIARGLIIQTDGKSIAVGYTISSNVYNFAVARYTSDGQLDTAFNTTGKNVFLPATLDAAAMSVKVQTNGNPVVTGLSWNGGNYDFATVRLTTDGRLDTTFKTNAKAITDFLASGLEEAGYSVDIDNNGAIIVGGAAKNAAGNLDFGFVRYVTDGSLDTTFATTGKTAVSITNAQDDVAFSIAVMTNKNVVAGGYTGSTPVFAMMRLWSSGALDTSFNTTGKTSVAIAASDDRAQSLHVIEEDIILLVGRTNNGSTFDMAAARYNTNGTLARAGTRDLTFMVNATVDISGNDTSRAFIVQTDGKVVSGAQLTAAAGNRTAMARWNKNGSIDTSFSTDGKLGQTYAGPASGTETAFWILLQTDGRLVTMGAAVKANDLGFMRFMTDGSLDTTFNTSGQKTLDGNGGNLDVCRGGNMDSNKILCVGGEGAGLFLAAKLLSDGSMDNTFNGDGKVFYSSASFGRGMKAVILSSGQTVVAGNNSADFYVARFSTDAILDTTFFTTGVRTVDVSGADSGHSIDVQPDGKFVTVGNVATVQAFTMIRYESDGSLDTSFATSGIRISDINLSGRDNGYGVMVMPNGRILVTGTTNGPDASTDYLIMRFNSSGVLDTTFGTSGVNALNVSGADEGANITITPSGKVCTGGIAGNNVGAACWWQ